MVRSGFVPKNFLIFLLTGGFAVAVNWGSRILYNLWMPYSAAIVVAYVTGMIAAFVLAKMFVFTESKQSTHRSAFFYACQSRGRGADLGRQRCAGILFVSLGRGDLAPCAPGGRLYTCLYKLFWTQTLDLRPIGVTLPPATSIVSEVRREASLVS